MSVRFHIIKQCTRPVAWLLITALVVIPIGGHTLGGLLLCLGDDGHVEFESSAGLRCSTFLDPENRPVEPVGSRFDALSGADNHCDSCLDILLLRTGDQDCGALQSKPVDYARLVGYTSIGGIHTTRLSHVTTRIGSRDSSSQTFEAGLSELRTVVLLI